MLGSGQIVTDRVRFREAEVLLLTKDLISLSIKFSHVNY